MTKKIKTYQDPKKLLRSIVIGAGVISAAYFAPKAVHFLSDKWQDADYTEEHHAIKELSGILEDRKANAAREGFNDDDNPYVQSVKRELKFRKKRHAAEKKSAKCKYCDNEHTS